LTVVATDLELGESVYFNSGPLIRPIQASCSIPGLFAPIKINGRNLVDGGVLDNMPFKPLQSTCDFLIGSHVNPAGRTVLPHSLRQVIERSMYLAINNATRFAFQEIDLLFEPPTLHRYSVLDIKKAPVIFEESYDYAKKILDNTDMTFAQ
jgi:NTE family protein